MQAFSAKPGADMLAIDTNVVVRFLAGDDPAQSIRARALIEREKVLVSLTVLLEAEWVLRSAYGFEAAQIAQALLAFAGLPNVTVTDAPALARALEWAAGGMDFADALHLAQGVACSSFVTFDERLVKTAKRLDAPEVCKP